MKQLCDEGIDAELVYTDYRYIAADRFSVSEGLLKRAPGTSHSDCMLMTAVWSTADILTPALAQSTLIKTSYLLTCPLYLPN